MHVGDESDALRTERQAFAPQPKPMHQQPSGDVTQKSQVSARPGGGFLRGAARGARRGVVQTSGFARLPAPQLRRPANWRYDPQVDPPPLARRRLGRACGGSSRKETDTPPGKRAWTVTGFT